MDIRAQTPQTAADFMIYNSKWVDWALSPIKRIYFKLHLRLSRMGALGRLAGYEPFLFFVLAVAAIFLLTPRYIVIAKYLIEKYLFQLPAVGLDTAGLPYMSNIIPLVIVVFLATYFFPKRYRITALFLCSPIIIYAGSSELHIDLDPLSAGVILLFYAACFLIIRSKIKRSLAVVSICSLSVFLILTAHYWDYLSTGAVKSIAFSPMFIPMLWYSVYQHTPPRRKIAGGRYLIYHFTRFFSGTPLIAYDDIFGKSRQTLAQIRFGGIKALFVVLLATTVVWAVNRLFATLDISQLQGFSLLGCSYLYYLRAYCTFVIAVNTVTGTLRLFGIPVRDNFNYWLFARTPNEHWRRWNILYREWIITFVFFPIMRKKRWLFVAVMAALLTSGLFHILRRITAPETNWYYVGYIVFYWLMNGLAIYLVIKIPLLFPKVVKRLNLQTSKIWAVTGIVGTSIFYAVLITLRRYRSLPEAVGYLERLITF